MNSTKRNSMSTQLKMRMLMMCSVMKWYCLKWMN